MGRNDYVNRFDEPSYLTAILTLLIGLESLNLVDLYVKNCVSVCSDPSFLFVFLTFQSRLLSKDQVIDLLIRYDPN